MKPTGRLQLWIWKIRLRLRESAFLRQAVRAARRLAPDSRARHLRGEVRFWKRWLVTQGLHWPDDFAARFDPDAPIQEHVARLVDQCPHDRVEILDVGAGPVTVLGKVHPAKQLSITATDVLGDEYAGLLAELGVTPLVPTLNAAAENLRHRLGERQFDIVHAQNALDHSADPFAALEEMFALTRPGGFIVLLHEENEGKNELYWALHKWDFTCVEGNFIIAGPGPNGTPRDVTRMFSGRASVECSIDAGEILVTMRKVS